MSIHVGDIVLYKTEGGYVYPAIVVDVHGGNLDLEVFTTTAIDRQQRYVEFGEMCWCERGS